MNKLEIIALGAIGLGMLVGTYSSLPKRYCTNVLEIRFESPAEATESRRALTVTTTINTGNGSRIYMVTHDEKGMVTLRINGEPAGKNYTPESVDSYFQHLALSEAAILGSITQLEMLSKLEELNSRLGSQDQKQHTPTPLPGKPVYSEVMPAHYAP